MARYFTFVRPTGEPSSPVSRARVLVVAARRLVPHQGPFTVSRDGYNHPGLHRAQALERITAMTANVDVGERIWAKDKAGKVVLDTKRVKFSDYLNPLRDCVGLRGLREDQGVDYSVTANSPVYAVGPGEVTIYRPVSGWPLDMTHSSGGAYIAYKLIDGPAKGKYVYDAEHITLSGAIKVGSAV